MKCTCTQVHSPTAATCVVTFEDKEGAPLTLLLCLTLSPLPPAHTRLTNTLSVQLAHNAAETGNMIQGTNVAVTGHVAVTETTKLATAPELARHGITAAEQAAGATVNNIVVVADAVMDTKDTFDLAVGIAEAANILSIAAKRAEALGFAAGVAIAAGVV